MEAAREGHEEMVALLLSQGADINAQTEETQETALTLACCGGFAEVADFLIKAGADIELGASTPLMEAAQEGHLDLVPRIHPELYRYKNSRSDAKNFLSFSGPLPLGSRRQRSRANGNWRYCPHVCVRERTHRRG